MLYWFSNIPVGSVYYRLGGDNTTVGSYRASGGSNSVLGLGEFGFEVLDFQLKNIFKKVILANSQVKLANLSNIIK
jgi:hypothetical protein